MGRRHELSLLSALLERAERGDGSMAQLSGEPGIGKTRLLEEVQGAALRRGFATAWGRAWELGGAPPYWPWIEALRTLIARPNGPSEDHAPLLRLLPELDPSAHVVSADRASTTPADAFQLSDALAGYLRLTCARQPVLLIFDDLHASDLSTLQLLEFVQRQTRDCRLLLLSSHRDVEARRSAAVDEYLGRLGRDAEHLALKRLGRSDVGALVSERIGHDDPETVRAVHEATDGNPLFVHELVRLVADRMSARSGALPASVRTVIRERLGLLAPATVALLQAAAVAGREFSLPLAADVAGVTPRAFEESAQEATDAGLLEETGPGRYRFSHAVVAEALGGELSDTLRWKLHLRAAEVLEAMEPTTGGKHPGGTRLSEIAHHYLQAGVDAAARAVEACRVAADAAEARLAFADAARLREQALDALASAAPGDQPKRGELLVAAARACARAGERAAAEARCIEATELARARQDWLLFVRAVLSLGAEPTVGKRDTALIDLLQEALDRLDEHDDPWRARAMARLASARQPEADPAPPMDLARAAIAMARRLDDGGDRTVLCEVLHSAMGALSDFAAAAERAELNAEAAERSLAQGDRGRALQALTRLAFDRIELLDVEGFAETVDRFEAQVRRSPSPRHESIPLLLRSMRAAWEGRFADAQDLEERARALLDGAAVAPQPAWPARRMGLAMLRGEPGPMVEAMRALQSVQPASPAGELLLGATAHALSGEREAARDRIARLTPAQLQQVHANVHLLQCMAELAWQLRDGDLARQTYAALLPHQGRPWIMTGIGYTLHGLADHSLFRMAHQAGELELAEQHAEAALAQAGQLASPVLSMVVGFELGAALQERGVRPERTRSLLDQARRGARDLGLQWWVERCGELQARLDRAAEPGRAEQPPQAASTGEHTALELRYEGDYWTVRGFGELCRIRDGRGMQMLAALVTRPGEALHVLELSGANAPVDAGDSGELIDDQAKAAYRARLRELSAEIDEAESWHDAARRERLQEEMEALRREISRAVGLGGRRRTKGAATERARSNVRRRLALVMQRVEEAAPRIGEHLRSSLKTGVRCTYAADGDGGAGTARARDRSSGKDET